MNELLFKILKSAITDSLLEDNDKQVSEEMLSKLVKVAEKHDIIHLLAYGLKKNGLISDENEISKSIMLAVFRYEQLNYDLEILCKALEEAKVPFIPLKGSVIRKYYPEPWMRTSCDIDILIHEKDLDKATTHLANNYGYTVKNKGSHDVSIYSSGNKHIELHYSLIEDGRANSSSKILENVWEYCNIKENYKYWYEMPDELFYFYHIAHMVKHFEIGGCGIRPFIDLLILDNIANADKTKRDELLDKCSLLTFTEVARCLNKVWFENEKHTELTQQTEEYILSGGVYGTSANNILIQQQKEGGQLKYALSKIFIPYDVIKFHYPILQKHRWLTPFMEVRRWFKLAFCGHAKRVMRIFKRNSSISNEEAKTTQEFLKNIGLGD